LLVFFDDLLIYNMTWEEHLEHLNEILSIMEDHSLYAKESKCELEMTYILYLGHVVSSHGVQLYREPYWIGHRPRTLHICVDSSGYEAITGDL
jgi:hypothetical protein